MAITDDVKTLIDSLAWVDVDVDWDRPARSKRGSLHVPWVVENECKRYSTHPRGGDMLLAGTAAVYKAALAFDTEHGDGKVPFQAYARKAVRREVTAVLNDWEVSVPRKKQKEYGVPRMKPYCEEAFGENIPDPTQVGEHASVEGALDNANESDNCVSDSASGPCRIEHRSMAPPEEMPILERLAEAAQFHRDVIRIARDVGALSEDWLDYEVWLDIARGKVLFLAREEMKRVLSERDESVITYHYGLNGVGKLSLAEVGETLGVTKERARQITRNAEQRLGVEKSEPETDRKARIQQQRRSVAVHIFRAGRGHKVSTKALEEERMRIKEAVSARKRRLDTGPLVDLDG